MELKNIKLVYITIFCLLVTTLSSCYNVLFDNEITTDEHTPRLVVNGIITDEAGPYFVRLSLTGKPTPLFLEDYTPVTNATVTISDNEGNIDVLKPSDEKYTALDSINTPDRTWGDMGYYQTTTNLLGTPGKTYTLSVVYNGKTYEATAKMPQSAPELELKHEDNYQLPFIYFDKPKYGKSYYMFYYSIFRNGNVGPIRTYWAHPAIPRSLWPTFAWQNILYDDAYLPAKAKVERLDIYGAHNYQTFSDDFFTPDSTTVEMHLVSKEVYNLYQALEQQKKNDGGAFSNLPGNPPSNISNGALGFFRVSSVSRKTIPFTR